MAKTNSKEYFYQKRRGQIIILFRYACIHENQTNHKKNFMFSPGLCELKKNET